MALSPMMRQYLEIKEKNKDCLLFFRLGDFYEMFFDDAITASKELEIALTGRDCGLEERAPMCGVPYHAAEGYIQRLIEKGYKVAICEQLEDPATAKGIVSRGIVRIVTPGTVSESSMLKEDENNFLLSVYECKGQIGAAYADISTGAFLAEEVSSLEELGNLLMRILPREILFMKGDALLFGYFKEQEHLYLTQYDSWPYDSRNAKKLLQEHFGVFNISVFGFLEESPCINAAGALLQYLLDTQKNSLSHIKKLRKVSGKEYMAIDPFTHRNLELTETMRAKERRGSLLWLLDKTKTAMGGRLLKRYIEQPLLNRKDITKRLDAVGELKEGYALRSGLRQKLDGVYDIERLLARISYGSLDARDLISLKSSIEPLPDIKNMLLGCKSEELRSCGEQLNALAPLYVYLDSCIVSDPPHGIRDGGFIKPGYHEEVDKLREAKGSGAQWLSTMEQRERDATGIKNLKIGYNKVFGYYIEVSKSNLSSVPYRYTRRQTLANCERYITQELKELEDLLLSATDKCNALEYKLFLQICEHLAEYIEALQKNAAILAKVDVLQSFAQAAYDYDYVKPTICSDGSIFIKGGRHPVVERTVREEFVPNDTLLDENENKLLVITGPNMAGKSTFMRQTGLIVLMAQIGCFVPAAEARISIVDRIFTRVGASDDLASGQSTFMVEMNELASILNSATQNSLLILDEIGRGTSTLDGLSIAWATIEYILGKNGIGAKTLFATHYHELTELEGKLPGLRNYSSTVREYGKSIVFLHKIQRGGADRSFGIEVARLAGLPDALTERAKVLLAVLQKNSNTDLGHIDFSAPPELPNKRAQEAEKLLKNIAQLDIDNLTPLEALSLLSDIKKKAVENG